MGSLMLIHDVIEVLGDALGALRIIGALRISMDNALRISLVVLLIGTTLAHPLADDIVSEQANGGAPISRGVEHLIQAAQNKVTAQSALASCAGDTRGDQKCNHDETHRVCAKIGEASTSFWKFTGQQSWCGSDNYGDGKIACPADKPTWCICKWATAKWIKGETCNDNINIECAATDICATEAGLFFSYTDGDVALGPAHDCIMQKCEEEWNACVAANPTWH